MTILLLTNDIEDLSMCLLDICMSSLEKYLFRISACFLTELFNCLIELFVFLSLSCMSSLSILDINPSMNM